MGPDGEHPCSLIVSKALNDLFFLQSLANISNEKYLFTCFAVIFVRKVIFHQKQISRDVFTCQIEKHIDAGLQTGGQTLTVGFHTSPATFQQDCHYQHKVQQCQF